MNKKDWYFAQLLKEADLDAAFASVESDINARAVDGKEAAGVVSGFGITITPGNTYTFALSAGVVIDSTGNRIVYPGATVDVSADSAGAPTDPSSGHSRWVSVAIRHGKHLSDAQTDGLGNTVYYAKDDSFNNNGTTFADDADVTANEAGNQKLYIVSGTEVLTGDPMTLPSLPADAVSLCDIVFTHAVTELGTPAMFFARRPHLCRRADLPTIAPTTGEHLTKRLLFVVDTGGDVHKTRVFASSGGLEITANASWDGVTGKWTADSTGFGATKYSLTSSGLVLLQKFQGDVGTPWTDASGSTSGWDTELDLGDTSVRSALCQIDSNGNILGKGVSVGYVSGAAPALTGQTFIAPISFRRRFLATPSSITLGSAGPSETRVSSVSTDNLNIYGADFLYIAASDGQLRAQRQYTVTQ